LVRIILTGYTDIESLIQAINAGRVYRYLTKPWNRDELLATVRQGMDVYRLAQDNVRLQRELEHANARLRVENAELKREARGRYRFEEIIGNSPALQQMLGLVERVVTSDATVLITGETGTGKELVARAIHYNGVRAERPFRTENCGALAPDMLTDELFGHKRGAFTGASDDREGLLESANGGTVFLDEIGDCPADLQTRLLRVLDQGEVRRIGENEPRRVDVRVLAATHHDLERDVENGAFRRDLFFRLNVVTIRLPALRERKEDIPLLVQHFVSQLCTRTGKTVQGCSAETVALLAAHDFPGNIRELRNEIERAFTLTEPGAYITADLLSPKFAELRAAPPTNGGGSLRAAVERYEAQLIREALDRNGGNQTRTATDLSLSRRGLIDKLQKYGIR
jgi:two-component system response regulator HupR/HoxA